MIVIEMPERGTLIKITNDFTYQSVNIHCKDTDQAEKLVLEIVSKVLSIEE